MGYYLLTPPAPAPRAFRGHSRAVFATPDMIALHDFLNEVTKLVDAGVLRTTIKENYSPINAVSLEKVHAMLESGKTIGKVVLEGW